jgi:hypothetical protein
MLSIIERGGICKAWCWLTHARTHVTGTTFCPGSRFAG